MLRFQPSLIVLFWLSTLTGVGQTLVVKDRITHQPIEFVQVYWVSQDGSAAISDYTDPKGRVDLARFVGTDTIRLRKFGYLDLTTTLPEIQRLRNRLYMNLNRLDINPIVVSVDRWQRSRGHVPNKVASIRPLDIALKNPQTAADLLAMTGDLQIQKSQQGGGSPMIRGFAANRVLLVVDGVRMNNAIFRSGNLQNVIALDPLATEHAEVIFGPGASVYGSDAIGGVMSFYTLRPRLSLTTKPIVSGNAQMRFASANMERTAHVDFNIGVQKWAFRSSFSLSNYDDLKMGSIGPLEYVQPNYVARINGEDSVLLNADPQLQTPTAYAQYNLMQKIRFRPSEKWDVNYGFHYSKSTDVPRYDRLIQQSNGLPRYGDWHYGPQLWMMNALRANHSDTTRFFDKLAATIAHQQFGESRHSRNFGSSIATNRTEKVDALSLNIDFEKALKDDNSTQYGFEVIHNVVSSMAETVDNNTLAIQPATTRYPDGSTWSSAAAYIGHRFSIAESFSIQYGVRYNLIWVKATFDTALLPIPVPSASLQNGAFSGSWGFAWRPGKSWQLNMNLAGGFRAPNIDDIGKVFDSEPGAVVVPNSALSPEYASSIDAGIIKTISSRLKVESSAFFTHLSNALVRRDFQLNGEDSIMYDGVLSRVQAIQNAARARVWGIQSGVEVELPLGFGLSSRFTYQRGTEELDDSTTASLRHAGPWFGSTHITYSRDRFTSDFYAIYNGRVLNKDLPPSEQNKSHIYATDGNGNPFSPSWFTLNLKVLYQITDFLAVSLGIENITDQRYKTYSSGIAAPGRNAVASLRGSF